MKKFLLIILTITMLFSMTAVAFADETTAKETIKVAINAEYPPFEYYENNKLTGFDIDLMNYIGERINYDIDYVEMSFDKLIPAVVNGEVDCAISAFMITKEIEGVVDFSEIYLDTYEQIDETSSQIVNYAIVFPVNSSEKEKLIEASGDKTNVLIYTLVNNAIKELKKDATIEKLLEKYNIPKANYAGAGPVIVGGGGVIPTDEENKISATSVPYSDWAKSDIEKAIALNIINVGGNYNFPAPITREEFCELIYNYCANVIGRFEPCDSKSNFIDTNNAHIKILNEAGIINGKSETEFAPNDSLTREEAATILNRLINAVHPDLSSTELDFEFADDENISDWAMSDVQRICNIGIMKGFGNNNFAPQDNYTTEQTIVTLLRVYDKFCNYSLKLVGKDNDIIITNEDLVSCEAHLKESMDMTGKVWRIEFTMTEDGRQKFYEATKRICKYPHPYNYIYIYINNSLISSPVVPWEIDSDTIFIEGDFTEETAKLLAEIVSQGITK